MPNLLRWFVDLAKEVDRGMSKMRGGELEEMLRKNARPEARVSETANGAIITIELNGVDPEDVDLAISSRGVLTVSGIIRSKFESDESYGLEDLGDLETFREVVKLPSGCENGEARATFKDGVLEISLEKSESEEEVRQLPIEKS
ncbi:MAG: Hsp20/alpha crystallin family protein [Rubrobacteraceae bacterium]